VWRSIAAENGAGSELEALRSELRDGRVEAAGNVSKDWENFPSPYTGPMDRHPDELPGARGHRPRDATPY
jgi:hypothetical protein